MTPKVPIPTAAHRALNELLAVYDYDDILLAMKVMAQEGDEDAAIAYRWLKDHHDEYLSGIVDGFEPV
jgi:hypothetical protein